MNEKRQYGGFKKPSWAPPARVFGPVWTALYAVIAWSFGIVFYGILRGVFPWVLGIPFALNLAFNFAFVPIEFKLKNRALALADILFTLGTLVWAMATIFPLFPWVAIVNIPYLAWLIFATALQVAVVDRNG